MCPFGSCKFAYDPRIKENQLVFNCEEKWSLNLTANPLLAFKATFFLSVSVGYGRACCCSEIATPTKVENSERPPQIFAHASPFEKWSSGTSKDVHLAVRNVCVKVWLAATKGTSHSFAVWSLEADTR